MGQEQAKTTQSEPTTFAENLKGIPTGGQHSLIIQNRFLLYENNYLRCVNNLLDEIGEGKKGNLQFSEPDQGSAPDDLAVTVSQAILECGKQWDPETCKAVTLDPVTKKPIGCECGTKAIHGKYPFSSQKDCDECEFIPALHPTDSYKGYCRCPYLQ